MGKGRVVESHAAATAGTMAERRGACPSGNPPALSVVPDPEAPAKPARRRFNAEYKLRLLREAERQSEPGRSAPCCAGRGCIRPI